MRFSIFSKFFVRALSFAFFLDIGLNCFFLFLLFTSSIALIKNSCTKSTIQITDYRTKLLEEDESYKHNVPQTSERGRL